MASHTLNTRTWVRPLLSYLALTALALLSIGPFLWLLSTSLKAPWENIFSTPPQLFPQQPTLQHYGEVCQKVPMAAYFINSFIITGLGVFFNLVFSVMAAYPLSRFTFKGKQWVFMAILATMMIPFQVVMIPLYMLMLQLNLVDTVSPLHGYVGVIIPFVVSGFGIFFVRQAMVQLPKDLEQSAILDGCNPWQLLIKIYLPLIKPTLATLAVFTFITHWGEFLWPSIVLTKQSMYPLTIGLVNLQGAFSANWRLIAAGTTLSSIPVVIFFLALQRYFIQGTLSGAIKG